MRDDRLMVIYCPVNGVPVLGHVTKDIRELRSLTRYDLIRLVTRGLFDLDELTGALKMEVLSV